MTGPEIILAALATPLIGAAGIALNHGAPNRREAVTLATAAALCLCVAALLPAVLAGERPGLTLFEVLPGLALGFSVEPLGMLFALVASGLWIVNSLYSIGYLRGNARRSRRASTSASPWRCSRRWASPSPPTCSPCSSSTSC